MNSILNGYGNHGNSTKRNFWTVTKKLTTVPTRQYVNKNFKSVYF